MTGRQERKGIKLEEYTHYNLRENIVKDIVACTGESIKRTTLKHTDVSDQVTCPACTAAMNLEPAQRHRRHEREQASEDLAAVLQATLDVMHFDFPGHHRLCISRRSKHLTKVIDEVTCELCICRLVLRVVRRMRKAAG